MSVFKRKALAMRDMGAASSGPFGEQAIDPNPIKLLPEQSLALYGLFNVKPTLTWPDIVRHKSITFASCLANGVTSGQMYSMQPDITQWICHGKCDVSNCNDMALWCPNPFTHFHCHIGDLVVMRKHLPPDVLRRCHMSVSDMRERYGMTGELMCMMQYSPQEWIELALTERDLITLTAAQFEKIFGKITRTDLIGRLHLR